MITSNIPKKSPSWFSSWKELPAKIAFKDLLVFFIYKFQIFLRDIFRLIASPYRRKKLIFLLDSLKASLEKENIPFVCGSHLKSMLHKDGYPGNPRGVVLLTFCDSPDKLKDLLTQQNGELLGIDRDLFFYSRWSVDITIMNFRPSESEPSSFVSHENDFLIQVPESVLSLIDSTTKLPVFLESLNGPNKIIPNEPAPPTQAKALRYMFSFSEEERNLTKELKLLTLYKKGY